MVGVVVIDVVFVKRNVRSVQINVGSKKSMFKKTLGEKFLGQKELGPKKLWSKQML